MKKSLFLAIFAFFTVLICFGAAAAEAANENPNENLNETMSVSISFAGDCTLGTDDRFGYWNSFPSVYDAIQEERGDASGYFFENVRHIFLESDLTVVNLEGPLTGRTEYNDKQFVFKGPPEYAEILSEGGIGLVNLSNNHTYDYGREGYIDTLVSLDAAGVGYFGPNWQHMKDLGGVTFGFLGYNGWSDALKGQITEDIAYIKECGATVIIVSFHWGEERANYPNGTQKALARHSIDQGAALVIGHHPHVLQGIESYNGGLIVYSLANFCFGGHKNPADKDTMIFTHTFAFDRETLERRPELDSSRVIPCSVSSVGNRNDFRPTVLEGDEGERVAERLERYSESLNEANIFDTVIDIEY
ncbi:MAG: CapA family protein [Clostridiales bacterium]|jgi:poly-gamma-glutamate synthesis protein (capsule biosynthesis protein)|nr:CapA family protein [Clostridiales bacterium]